MEYIAYWCLVISVIAFLTYGADKSSARRGAWRTSESKLHLLSLLGGWPGAFLGRKVFRHKTQKKGFAGWLYTATLANLIIMTAILAYLAEIISVDQIKTWLL